jgi:hypothetical protein
MSGAVETVMQALAWLRGELLISALIAGLLVGPGAVLCWFGYHVTAVRLAPGATRPARFRRRPGAIDRVEQRLAHLCTALSILTDSTESGLRAAISGLERLSGRAVEPLPAVDGAIEEDAAQAPPVIAAPEGRSAREIAIAEGVSEGEVRLRLHLQGT